jgi:O-antigen ligase
MDIALKQKTIMVINRVALFFFGVLVFFLPISHAIIESSFGFIFLCFLIKAILERPSLERVGSFFKNRINLSLLVFYIAIAFSMFAAGALWTKSFIAWFFKWGEGVLLFYFAQAFLDRRRVTILLWVLIASGFLVSLDGIYQWINGVDFIMKFALVDADRYMGVRATFNHYNGFATFMLVSFFIVIGILRQAKNLRLRLLLLLIALLFIGNLLLSHSRGGWVSFIVVNLLTAIFLRSRREKTIAIFFIGFFVVSIMSMPFLRERFSNIIQVGGDADRFRVWSVALAMFRDSPFIGKGLGLFMHHFSEYSQEMFAFDHRPFIQYAHNCYLQILSETGLIGLISFLWFIIELLKSSFMKLKRDCDFLFVGLLLAYGAFLIHMLVDTQLYSLKLAILFWLLSSFLVCSKESL